MRTGRENSLVSGRRVALVSLICVTLLGACVACSGNVDVEKPQPNPADRFYGYRAFTLWSCNKPGPVIFVRAPIKDSLQYRISMAHEFSHAAFALSFPSCEAYQEWRRDPENTLTLEALATCAAIRQQVRDDPTTNTDSAVMKAAAAIVSGYGIPNLTVKRARARILAVCR